MFVTGSSMPSRTITSDQHRHSSLLDPRLNKHTEGPAVSLRIANEDILDELDTKKRGERRFRRG
jgi:hypothetical protein